MKKQFLRFIPLIVIGSLMFLAYRFNITSYFTFEQLKAHRETILAQVEAHPILAPLLYTLFYMVSTTLSLPIAVYLTIFGGFIFPQPFSTLYVVTGATVGAVNIFLAASTALKEPLRKKAGPFISKMQKGFNENAISYLLFLRLVPLFPFWVVNLTPAFLGAKLTTFTWTTFVGIIPGVFVFTQAGRGLGAIFETDTSFSIEGILNKDLKIALIALGLFALIPLILKKLKRSSSP